MPAQWLSHSGSLSGRLGASVQDGLRRLAQPGNLRRLRTAVLVLLALWSVLALARLLWVLLPTRQEASMADLPVINPLTNSTPAAAAEAVDIEAVRGWHLFGEVGANVVPVPDEPVAQPAAREGIEKGAKETRLQLVLRGVVASSDEGLGHAIIEYRKKQAVYAVEDKLPVSGNVVLAKVMPRKVVLDNGGTYELLTLYEETALDSQLPASGTPRRASEAAPAQAVLIDKRQEQRATELARSYRQQLYQDPQSLADVVSINAVREDGELKGYRVSPGRDREQFEQLGFKPGDLVTAVNGIALNDPANTMRLYQTMRTASEAVFELERGEQPLSISVSLGEAANP